MRKCLSVLMAVCGILRKCIVPWTTSLQKHAKLLSDLMEKLNKSIFDFGITFFTRSHVARSLDGPG